MIYRFNGFKNDKEGWKEIFLDEISKRYGFEKIIIAENIDYKLIGLPFFNKDHNNNFITTFEELIKKDNKMEML